MTVTATAQQAREALDLIARDSLDGRSEQPASDGEIDCAIATVRATLDALASRLEQAEQALLEIESRSYPGVASEQPLSDIAGIYRVASAALAGLAGGDK